MFKKFLSDLNAWDMYITGSAGTGKTTSLRELVQHCIEENIDYLVCAFTHKACGILREKLPAGSKVATLHSFLGKRPAINIHATKSNHVNINVSSKGQKPPKVLLVDEFSMIGEKDYMDLRELQDGEYEATPNMKIVWIGDSKQLPPVGDQQAVNPEGPYWQKLTKIWRNDNPLQRPLNSLISFIEQTAEPSYLEPVEGYFERNKDIIEEFKSCKNDKVLLAYTNRTVQMLNSEISGKERADVGDIVFSPTTQKKYVVKEIVTNPTHIDLHYGEALLLGTKFKTLEHLIKSNLCAFMVLEDEEGNLWQHAVLYGHYNYKVVSEDLSAKAVKTNSDIERANRGFKAATWAKINYTTKLARDRAKAWRDFLTFNDCVICIDAPYAMTIHKSQGSTYENVFLDMKDLAICRDLSMQLRLAYVGISRASKKVVTN